MYAVVEIFDGEAWQLAHPLEASCDYNGDLVPKNIAPESWGKYNFKIYYEASAERDFPEDMSLDLKAFVLNHFEWPNRPSWMTLAEITQFFESDIESRCAHLDFESLQKQFDVPADQLRIVFWAY